MAYLTLPYFESLQTVAFHKVSEIYDDPTHESHDALVKDLWSISDATIAEFESKYRYLFNRSGEGKDMDLRKMFFEYDISTVVARKRLNILHNTEKGVKSLPYIDSNLAGVPIDEHGLVPISELKFNHFYLYYETYAYQLCPSLDQFNSSHWLGLLILNETFRNRRNFKIRLDPLMREPVETFQPYIALMQLHGKKLDWTRLKTLRTEEFGQWLGDGLSTSSILTTDYVWRPEKQEVHFTCEELPKPDCIDIRGSRYFHAIFDKSTGNITHCDGALRIYDEAEFTLRQKYHVRQPEVRKIGKRVKLFLIDDVIDQELFMSLATNFLVWNQDALEYFN